MLTPVVVTKYQLLHSNTILSDVQAFGRYLPLAFGRTGVAAVDVALPNLALTVMQDELCLVLARSLSACLLSFSLTIMQR